MPTTNIPTSSSTKLLARMARTQTAPPAMPMLVPSRNPARRPWRFMKNEAGRVDTAAPSTYVTTGMVASRRDGARASPASAVTAAISTAFVSSSI